MNPRSHQSQTDATQAVAADAVLCQIDSLEDLQQFALASAPLKQIGFTGIAISEEVVTEGVSELEAFEQQEFSIYRRDSHESIIDLSDWHSGASALWSGLEAAPSFSLGADLSREADSMRNQHEATALLQMASSPVPQVPISQQLVYSSKLREQRELLRSLVFWRKRFDIAGHIPKLVHAGTDGLLLFLIDSWLVTVNQNPEEATIDLGTQGSMWLMLGTQRDVHLHGSMLILPPNAGAIVANELAR